MNIQRVFKQKGLTIQQVADKMGVKRITLAKTVTGNPTIDTLERIAKAIDCDIVDFFTEDTSQVPKTIILDGKKYKLVPMDES